MAFASVTAKDQYLQRQNDRLDTNDQRVYQGDCVDDVQIDLLHRPDVLGDNQFMIVAVDVGDAAAAWWHVIEHSGIKRLECSQHGAGGPDLLQFGQLVGSED